MMRIMRAPWVKLSRPGPARGKRVSLGAWAAPAAIGLAGLAAALAWPAGAGAADLHPGAAPSFSCAHAAGVEAAICADPQLSALDRRLATLYARAKPGVLGAGSNQLAVQRDWLHSRDQACAGGAWKTGGSASLAACVAAAYRTRIEALAIATLFDDPASSVSELRAVDPKAAPVYEALWTYAATASDGDRARKVEALLSPLYASMDDDERTAFQTSGGLASSAHAAAASDHGFARFFDVSSMFGSAELTWPCAALLRRAGLLQGLGSFWGGAVDARVPDSDCEAVLPPLPRVSALADAALAVQPPCEGTIRFSTGRDFAMLRDAVRLHRADLWKGAAGKPGPAARAWLATRAASSAAAAELADYYAADFKLGAAEARADATAAIGALAAAAFSLCD